MSILGGVDDLVDTWLGIEPKGKRPYYQHQAAANDLASRDVSIDGSREFLHQCYEQIHNNWIEAVETGYSKPSKQNWRWKQHLELPPNNKSPELLLERKIVEEGGDNWSNQMPVASGLVGQATDKRAAVDLVHREDENRFSLIELKVDSNNPLFAAIEILFYGLLFVWSKNNLEVLGYDIKEQPVLAATELNLCVLAPVTYYIGCDLGNLSQALNAGLYNFDCSTVGLSFEFKSIPTLQDCQDI